MQTANSTGPTAQMLKKRHGASAAAEAWEKCSPWGVDCLSAGTEQHSEDGIFRTPHPGHFTGTVSGEIVDSGGSGQDGLNGQEDTSVD